MIKRGGRGQERGERKLSFRFVPTQLLIVNSKKIEKNSKSKKTSLWLLLKPKRVGRG